MDHAIVLFDGDCNFCNSSVNFIIDHDLDSYFKFAALQSETGQRLLSENGVLYKDLDSIILVEFEKLYSKSTAALRIARRLSGWPSILYDFIIIPIGIRDLLYDLFARNRYRLFGRKEVCRIPSPEERSRFI